MSNDPYLRNPKGTKGGKFENEQDLDDFAQEQLIKDWLEREGRVAEFEFKHISRHGTARNTLVKAEVRLDAQAFDDSARTFADLIAGCDGRDLLGGRDADEIDPEPKAPADLLDENIDLFFDAIGASEGTKAWAKKSIKSGESLRRLRSLMKDDKPFEISPINSAWLKPWDNFRK